jgi:hypothetical protein
LKSRRDLVTEKPEEFEVVVVSGEEREREEEDILHAEERHQHKGRPCPLPFLANNEKKAH